MKRGPRLLQNNSNLGKVCSRAEGNFLFINPVSWQELSRVLKRLKVGFRRFQVLLKGIDFLSFFGDFFVQLFPNIHINATLRPFVIESRRKYGNERKRLTNYGKPTRMPKYIQK